jgi:hypothetical protein
MSLNSSSQEVVFQGKIFDKIKFDILTAPVSFNKKMNDNVIELSLRYSIDYIIKNKFALKLCGSNYIDLNKELNSYSTIETYGFGFGYITKGKYMEELTVKTGILYNNKISGYYYDLALKHYFCNNAYVSSGINHQFNNNSSGLFSFYCGFGIRIF